MAGGERAPFYMIPFDESGVCVGPATRKHLIETAVGGRHTDVFVFSHGWNNTWPTAVARYESFITGFARTRAERPLPAGRGFRPLLVGVFWPSAVLVDEDEEAPAIAGGSTIRAHEDAEVAAELDAVTTVAAALPADARVSFYALAQKDALSEAEVAEFAALLAPLWGEEAETDDLGPDGERPGPEDLVAVWRELASSETSGESGFGFAPGGFGFGDVERGATGDAMPSPPLTAGLGDLDLRRLHPRQLIRGTTVWMMKDRAGRVGTRGVGPLVADLLEATGARVHLVGHSYGGKVALSALCAQRFPRPVESALLLQPAVSHLCFSEDVPGLNRPGGYRAALDPRRCRQPLLTTFSARDVPLTRTFHLALRRRSDLGEVGVAGAAPSRYAALGGFGPGGLDGEATVVPAAPPGARYPLGAGARVIGVEASSVISGHGDISNPSTWWMLLDQVAQGG